MSVVVHTTEPDTESSSILRAIFADKSLLLFVTAVVIQLGIGFLMYYHIAPRSARWLSDILVVAMIGITFVQMILSDHVPSAMVIVAAITVIGVTVAAFEGQAPAAMVWGWWILFRYPMIGFYVYLNSSHWPRELSGWLYRFFFLVLGIQVIVQVLQYLAGEPPGDNLTGTFGRQSSASLVLFILLSVALAFGHWLAFDDWKALISVLIAGGISSALGAMRIYPVGVAVIMTTAMIVYILSGKRIGRSFFYSILAALAIGVFVLTYNRITAETRGLAAYQDNLLDFARIEQYFGGAWFNTSTQTYTLGRTFSVIYGWQTLQRDVTTQLFGYGLGARAYSTSLDIVGEQLSQSLYGAGDSLSSLTLIQELGVTGLLLIGSTFLWIFICMWRCVRNNCSRDLAVLAYGIMFFTAGWPMWLFYSRAWSYGKVMLLYWGVLGYVLQRYYSHRQELQQNKHRHSEIT